MNDPHESELPGGSDVPGDAATRGSSGSSAPRVGAGRPQRFDYPELLRAQAETLLAVALKHLDAPVPGCPGWDCRRLVRHVARLLVTTAAHLPRKLASVPERVASAPAEAEALADYYRRGLADVLEAFRTLDPTAPAWNFTLEPAVVAFWARRLAHEFQVHASDAAEAAGRPRALDPEVAADGVDELLRVLLPAARAAGLSPAGDGSVHVHLTDVPGEWLVRLDDTRVTVTPEHAKGDAALRGPAGTVLLALWGRVGLDAADLAAFGDVGLIDAVRPGR